VHPDSQIELAGQRRRRVGRRQLIAARLQHGHLQRVVGGPELQQLGETAAAHQRQTKLVRERGVGVLNQVGGPIVHAAGNPSGGAPAGDRLRLGLGLLDAFHGDVPDQMTGFDSANSRARAAPGRRPAVAEPRLVQLQTFHGIDARHPPAEHTHRSVVAHAVGYGGTVEQNVDGRVVLAGDQIQGHGARQTGASPDPRAQDDLVDGRGLVHGLVDPRLHQRFRNFQEQVRAGVG